LDWFKGEPIGTPFVIGGNSHGFPVKISHKNQPIGSSIQSNYSIHIIGSIYPLKIPPNPIDIIEIP
jgi:hypothetical protein